MDYRDLPYDAEIEYLQSTGTQWIDTEYRSDNTNAIELTVVTDGTSGFMGSNGNLQMDLTLSKGLGKRTMMVTHSKNIGPKTYVNGSLVKSQNYHTYNGYIIALFALGNSGTTVSEKTRAKVYSSELRVGNITVRDLIPVRVGNVGYMYDRVSGQLFGNSGTGSFVLGPDVAPGRYANEIAFLGSTGSQYIDTGVSIDTNTKLVVDGKFTDTVATDMQFHGVIQNIDENYYRYHIGRSSGSGPTKFYVGLGTVATSSTVAFDANRHTFQLLGSGTAYIDTTQINGNSDVPNLNIYLFARNFNNEAGAFCKFILYSAKIYSGDTLVRDFIPVEYNNIGYLYDKVSGEFFANQGTGKFVLGHRAPRFDGKACARSYTRRQLMAEIAYPKPYISNGLIFHLDSRDVNGSTWVDRIGGKVLTLYNTTLQNGGVKFTGNRHCRAEAGDGVTLTAPAASSTIEIVGHRLVKRSIEMIFSPGVKSSIFYVGRNTYVTLGSSVRLAQFTAPLPVGKFTHSLRATLHYYNGTKMTTTSSTVASNTEPSICVGGNEVAAGNMGFNGIIYQIRIYNRLLTEDEIKFNQEQDHKRYGIQF